MTTIYIEEIARYVGQDVTIRGWLRNRRASGKVQFLIVRDGTGDLQAVISKGVLGEEQFAQLAKLTQESSLILAGRVRSDARAHGGFELEVSRIELVQIAEPFPVQAKAAGHYNNAQLIKMEAVANGYAEGLVLSPDGRLSEGGGQNVFLVRGGILVTPQLDGTLLRGITRDAVMVMAADLGLEVQERPVPREDLYTADELFFTGTATEVTPIRSVDRITIGEGRVGPVTLSVQKRFMAVVKGEEEDLHGWLTPVCQGG